MAAARVEAALLGAIVADAAALSTHWIYAAPELQAALAAHPAFGPVVSRWHPQRAPGSGTLYGEHAMVLARSLAERGGLAVPAYRKAFLEAFGAGGSYVGYVDKATKHTVFNLLKLAADNEAALAPGAPGVDRGAAMKLFPLLGGLAEGAADEAAAGEAAAAKLREVAGDAATEPTLAWARGAGAAQWRMAHTPAGAKDDQSNALGKLVPAAAFYAGKPEFAAQVEAAIRATQDHDAAVAWLLPAARMVEAAVTGAAGDAKAAVEAGIAACAAGSPQRARLEEAVAAAGTEGDAWAAGQRFGNSCPAASTVPLAAWAMLRGAQGAAGAQAAYEAAVKLTIASGGENAARACLVGGVMGALAGGVPDAWLQQVEPKLRASLVETSGKLAAAAAGKQ